MEGVIRKYNDSNKNLNVLIEELDLGKDYFKATYEVFFVKVPPEKFTFDFPNGNEVGAYDELWIPGGYTIHGTKEAVISNSENLIHNKDWNTFINFSYGKASSTVFLPSSVTGIFMRFLRKDFAF